MQFVFYAVIGYERICFNNGLCGCHRIGLKYQHSATALLPVSAAGAMSVFDQAVNVVYMGGYEPIESGFVNDAFLNFDEPLGHAVAFVFVFLEYSMGNPNAVELNEKSAKRRFFVALLPPADVQERVNEVKGVMRDRFSSKAAFRSPPHITVHAPFEWPVSAVSRLQDSLSKFAYQQSPPSITLDGFSAFAPHVIYINVIKREGLMALQPNLLAHLESDISLVSKQDRRRAYVPHLTVAFRDLKPNMFRKAWSEFQRKEFHADFTASHLSLLAHNGKLWTVKENYEFVG